MRCPKSRFPIQIIVFDELELIIFVSQGLTLSTASLVSSIYFQFHPRREMVTDPEDRSNQVTGTGRQGIFLYGYKWASHIFRNNKSPHFWRGKCDNGEPWLWDLIIWLWRYLLTSLLDENWTKWKWMSWGLKFFRRLHMYITVYCTHGWIFFQEILILLNFKFCKFLSY